LKKKITLQTINLSKSGSESKSNVAATTGVGYVGAFLIYFFIFLYGAQIMRGVIEEKMNTFSFGFIEYLTGSMRNGTLVLTLYFLVGIVFLSWSGLLKRGVVSD